MPRPHWVDPADQRGPTSGHVARPSPRKRGSWQLGLLLAHRWCWLWARSQRLYVSVCVCVCVYIYIYTYKDLFGRLSGPPQASMCLLVSALWSNWEFEKSITLKHCVYLRMGRAPAMVHGWSISFSWSSSWCEPKTSMTNGDSLVQSSGIRGFD